MSRTAVMISSDASRIARASTGPDRSSVRSIGSPNTVWTSLRGSGWNLRPST